MIPFTFLKKLLLSFFPLILMYLLKKGRKEEIKRKNSPFSEIDKSKIVEGEIVEETHEQPETRL